MFIKNKSQFYEGTQFQFEKLGDKYIHKTAFRGVLTRGASHWAYAHHSMPSQLALTKKHVKIKS